MERLQKIIAQAGLCSRRRAEDLLRQGRVFVNGHKAALGDQAEASDAITVDGVALSAAPAHVYLMLHKPAGYVTTLSDERGRATAAELVAACGVRVFPVGRLDRNSEGLLLFTNDGALAQSLLHPRSRVNKVYRVSVHGAVDGAKERLAQMRMLDGEPIAPAKVRFLTVQGDRAVLEITIHQGKKRQVRRMCQAAGLTVDRLVRVQEGGLMLGNLECGKWRYLTDIEIKELKGLQ